MTPNQDSILAAMMMAFRDWAIPVKVHVDQGKDFTSELILGYTKRERRELRKKHGPQWRDIVRHEYDAAFHGILAELDIGIVEAIPYSPWSKGIQERWYRTFQDRVSRSLVTYCGNAPANRPDALKTILAENRDADVPELADCTDIMRDAVELYNRSPHGGIEDRKPIDVWNSATRLRRAVEDELILLMQTRGVYRVRANGVSIRVRSQTFGFGASCTALRRFKGRNVLITLDPTDCSHCYAFTAEHGVRRFIGRLEANERIPANCTVEELSEAIRSVRRRRKVMGDAQREMPNRIRNASAEVRALRREQLRECRATGTDDAHPDVAIVHTGFEGVSRPARSLVEIEDRPTDGGDISDLFMDDEELAGRSFDDDSIDEVVDLLFDEEDPEPPDHELDAIL